MSRLVNEQFQYQSYSINLELLVYGYCNDIDRARTLANQNGDVNPVPIVLVNEVLNYYQRGDYWQQSFDKYEGKGGDSDIDSDDEDQEDEEQDDMDGDGDASTVVDALCPAKLYNNGEKCHAFGFCDINPSRFINRPMNMEWNIKYQTQEVHKASSFVIGLLDHNNGRNGPFSLTGPVPASPSIGSSEKGCFLNIDGKNGDAIKITLSLSTQRGYLIQSSLSFEQKRGHRVIKRSNYNLNDTLIGLDRFPLYTVYLWASKQNQGWRKWSIESFKKLIRD